MDVTLTADVLAEYETIIKNLKGVEKVKEARVYGSFGRNDSNPESDLDVWFIVKKLPPLLKMVDLSNHELTIRLKLGEKYGLSNLGRHRCTIFTQTEANFYEIVFPVRVGTLRFLGETKSLWGGSKGIINTAPKNDIVVSLTEFEMMQRRALQKGDRNLARKYTRRALRELYYYRTGERHVSNESVDDVIRLKYNDSNEKVFYDVRNFINEILSTIPKESIYYRDLCHRLVFTMEKVRWELVYGLSNKIDYINWVQEKANHHAFFPSEIIKLVLEASSLFGTDKSKEVFLLNMISTKVFSPKLISEFHNYHTRWMLDNARLALERSIQYGG